jgi:hypothetical protein
MLGKAFSLYDDNSLTGTGISYRTFSFSSDHTRHLPGLAKMNDTERDFLSAIADSEINENREFRYPVFLPEGYKQTNRAIILLHGLNEKSWDKYLPWAR